MSWLVASAVGLGLLWVLSCVWLARRLNRQGIEVESNPIAWIPFFVLAPLGALAFLLFGVIAGPVVWLMQGFGFWRWSRTGVRAEVDDRGISLASKAKGPHRELSWDEIAEWKRVFNPPAYTYRVVLRSGEQVHVDFVDEDVLRHEMQRREIPWTETTRGELNEEP